MTSHGRERIYHRLLQQGYDRYRLDRLILWEMDHVQPVIEGGGGTGLENLQTLCVPCQKRKTAGRLRQRRADQRGFETSSTQRAERRKNVSRAVRVPPHHEVKPSHCASV